MSDQTADNPDTHEEEKNEKFIPFFPNYLLDEVIAWYIGLAALIAHGSTAPVGESCSGLSTC